MIRKTARYFYSLFFVALVAAFFISNSLAAEEEFLVANFDSGDKPNLVGGNYGTWDYNPSDESQTCVMDYSDQNFNEYAGRCLKLTYDVQSARPAFNGFWMSLEKADVNDYDKLAFWVKGDSVANFTSRFKVELKNSLGKRAVYFVKDVTSEWKEVIIDFKRTPAIEDWKDMTEFTVVFSDLVSTHKEGVIYIDNIRFFKEPAGE